MQRFPQALLLDLDGTLINSENIHVELVHQFMKEHGIVLSGHEKNYVIGHAWQDIHRYLHVYERVGFSISEFVQAILLRKHQLFTAGVVLPVTDGAVELISLVHQENIPIAVVSGSSRAEIEQALVAMEVQQKIEFYLGAEDYYHGKPAPDCYLLAAERLGIPPADCLVIEDSEAGISAAITAGMRVLATSFCNPPETSSAQQNQTKAHKIVATLAGLTIHDLALVGEDR